MNLATALYKIKTLFHFKSNKIKSEIVLTKKSNANAKTTCGLKLTEEVTPIFPFKETNAFSEKVSHDVITHNIRNALVQLHALNASTKTGVGNADNQLFNFDTYCDQAGISQQYKGMFVKEQVTKYFDTLLRKIIEKELNTKSLLLYAKEYHCELMVILNFADKYVVRLFKFRIVENSFLSEDESVGNDLVMQFLDNDITSDLSDVTNLIKATKITPQEMTEENKTKMNIELFTKYYPGPVDDRYKEQLQKQEEYPNRVIQTKELWEIARDKTINSLTTYMGIMPDVKSIHFMSNPVIRHSSTFDITQVFDEVNTTMSIDGFVNGVQPSITEMNKTIIEKFKQDLNSETNANVQLQILETIMQNHAEKEKKVYYLLQRYIERYKKFKELEQKHHNSLSLITYVYYNMVEIYNRLMALNNGNAKRVKSGGKTASNIINILGRNRKIFKDGRKSMITYKGNQICLTDARALERAQKIKRKKI